VIAKLAELKIEWGCLLALQLGPSLPSFLASFFSMVFGMRFGSVSGSIMAPFLIFFW
jgi:hypothetical protein